MISIGKKYSFSRTNGMTTVAGYVLFDEPAWVTVKTSDHSGPINLNKAFITSYTEVEA